MQYNHELDSYIIDNETTLRQCIMGGKGSVCLVAPSMKAHTYHFLKPRNESKFPDNTIFVYVIHEDHMYYIGMISHHTFKLTANSAFDEDTESVKGAKYIMRMVNEPGLIASTPMKIYHNGKCAVCGRSLDSEKSIASGVGPKCLHKLKSKLNVY